jgi:HSP20 family protein
MKMSAAKFLTTAVMMAMVVSAIPAWAASDEEVAVLRKQVAELNAKIDVLEKGQAPQAQGIRPVHPQMQYNSWDPFAEMDAMQEQMNNLVATSFNRGPGMGIIGPMGIRQSFTFNPGYDIKGTDKGYVVTFDMPGMDKSKIDVQVKDGTLYVSGERSSSEESKGDKMYRQERSFGYFSRTIPLPKDAKPDSVQAKYDNGVLMVTIDKLAAAPKKEDSVKKIEVK